MEGFRLEAVVIYMTGRLWIKKEKRAASQY